MSYVEPLRPEASQARFRLKPRFPVISTVAAACLAAGAIVGNTSTTAYLDLPTMAAHPSKAVKKSAKAASFTLAYVRVAGKSRINQEGVTCYTGPVSFGVGLEATEMGARFSYR
ncbi:hypothetical protein E1267_37740 [Nonomuraea longispora]|uniref:Uncharacterized protein n=3 Tax=Nonomuraea TaxID=83681 RepID=A0A4R4MYG2_9ACTN|nr:hypothetical protein [Nonomuraea longispora]TDB99386.1 hypothetical protein E1267_37740 [Nonomuraea longispora]